MRKIYGILYFVNSGGSMSIKIALLGFGTVGRGTYRVLEQNADEIRNKTGKSEKL